MKASTSSLQPARLLLTFCTKRFISAMQNIYRREKYEGKEGRPIAGNARPAGAQSAGSRSAAWAGCLAPDRANDQRDFPGQTGIALPVITPDGGGGLAQVNLG